MADGSDPMLLGIPDAEIDEEDDQLCRWDTNKFGGRPNWMTGSPDMYPTCDMCGEVLLLVAQVYCPLYNSMYHRTLYIFGCANPPCWNKSQSWLILRCQTLSSNDKQETLNKSHETQSSVDDWCDDAGDWGDDLKMADLECRANRMTLHSTVHEIKEENHAKVINSPDLPPPRYNIEAPFFTPHHISVFEDTTTVTKKTGLTAHEEDLLAQYQQHEGKDFQEILNSSADNKVAENYEKTSVAHGDGGFHKFVKYLQSCPHQCIRYQWNGTPLTISESYKPLDMSSTISPCQYCGASRVCELQLMPALVLILKDKETQLPSNHVANSYKNTSDDVTIVTGCHGDEAIAKDNVGCQIPYNNAVTKYKDTSDVPIVTSCHGDEAIVKENVGRQIPHNNAVTEYKDTSDVPIITSCHGDNNAINKDEVIAENIDSHTLTIKQLRQRIPRDKKTRIEFGTVVVFSCSQSCWDDNNTLYRQEYVLVQADPDIELFPKTL